MEQNHMNHEFIIEDIHRKYLELQKGRLHDLIPDRSAWDAAFHKSLHGSFKTIENFLPDQCAELLDVGSGLGSIDVLINKFYGGNVFVRLLDGIDDPPIMVKHNQTFNNMAVARDFLMKNDVRNFDYIDLHLPKMPVKFDLVVSFGAWCFHFPPSLYLDFVKEHTHSESVIIVDMRKEKPEWMPDMCEAFGKPRVIRESRKFVKMAFGNG